MKNQALFSSKDKSKKSKCRLLQFLFGGFRVELENLSLPVQGVFGKKLDVCYHVGTRRRPTVNHEMRTTFVCNDCFCILV